MKKVVFVVLGLVIILGWLCIPVERDWGRAGGAESMSPVAVETLNLSSFPDAPPARALRLLFLHHSCGGQLLADPGPSRGADSIHASHPNGGGLRALLEKNGYQVHEASYGSEVGEKTDLFDWPAKFGNQMDQVLACDLQNTYYGNGTENEIVLFKSCYPNNAFVAAGTPPGKAGGPALTVWNAKACYGALLEKFVEYPRTLFVCVTAPPLAPKEKPAPLWKTLAKEMLGKGEDRGKSAALAREFNNWLKSRDGWLKGYGGKNVVVFDYFHLLSGEGRSDLSAYATGDGTDSHPSSKGNRKAAEALVPFLNRAVRRAGLSD